MASSSADCPRGARTMSQTMNSSAAIQMNIQSQPTGSSQCTI